MGLLWVPLQDKHAFTPRYAVLSSYGQVFLFYRSLFGMQISDHDVPASFNTSTAEAVVLLRGRSVSEDLYLGNTHRAVTSVPTTGQLAVARLKEKGLKPVHLIKASFERVPEEYRAAFGLALEEVIDKYFIKP